MQGLWIWSLIVFLSVMGALILLTAEYIARRLAKPKVRSIEAAKAIELERTPDLFHDYETWPKQSFWLSSPHGAQIRCHYVPSLTKNDPVFPRLVIVAHGFRHTHYGAIKYASLFRKLGYDALLFDQRRHGETAGSTTTLGFCEKDDVVAIAEYCFQRFGTNLQLGLVGESMGAATVLLASPMIENLKFVVADCPFGELKTLAAHQIHTLHKLPLRPFVGLSSLFFKLLTGAYYKDVSPLDAVKKLQAPVLFVHGTADRTIPYAESVKLHEAAHSPKRLVLFEDTRHAESFRKNRLAYASMIESFLKDLVQIQTLDFDYANDQEEPHHV